LNAPHSKCGIPLWYRGFESLPLREAVKPYLRTVFVREMKQFRDMEGITVAERRSSLPLREAVKPYLRTVFVREMKQFRDMEGITVAERRSSLPLRKNFFIKSYPLILNPDTYMEFYIIPYRYNSFYKYICVICLIRRIYYV
jgi:hypothetical protein